MRGEVSARSLERGGGCEERCEGVWKDCPGLEREGFLIRFRVWTVFSKPQRDKEGCEPRQSGGNINAGIKAQWEARRLTRKLGESSGKEERARKE